MTGQEPIGMMCGIEVSPRVAESGREQWLDRDLLLNEFVPELAIVGVSTEKVAGLRQVGKGDGVE